MKNPLDFTGKVALVTGAAAGMGLATVQAFAEAGAAECWRFSRRHRQEFGSEARRWRPQGYRPSRDAACQCSTPGGHLITSPLWTICICFPFS